MDLDAARFEQNLPAGPQPRGIQILHHLVLGVHRDRAAAGERVHIDAMPVAGEAQFDAVMHQSFAMQPLAHARLGEQIHRALLQHARAHPLFGMFAGLSFDHYGIDAFEMEQGREDQAGRPGSDDTDLGAKFAGCCHGVASNQTRSIIIAMPWPTPMHMVDSA